MAKKNTFPRKLKVAADPSDAFAGLQEMGRDFPGARSWGTAERGFTVNVGAGFDFGPLLTCGAPVITAEVGAAASVGAAQNLVLMLERKATDQLTLSKFSGWSINLGAALEAKVGVGIPEDWGATAGAMVPDVKSFGLKAKLEEKTLGNPLAEDEEPAVPSDDDLKTELEGETPLEKIEDRSDFALESLQSDDLPDALPAPLPTPTDASSDSPSDLVPDTAADSADKVIDASAIAKGELKAGLRYLIVRDPAPEVLTSLTGVRAAMALFISNTAKAVLKDEVEEFIAEHTADVSSNSSGPDKVTSALKWMNLVPAPHRTDKWTSLNDKLLACQALSPSHLESLRSKVQMLYVLNKKDSLSLKKLLDFGPQITKWKRAGSERLPVYFPDFVQFNDAKAFLVTYTTYFKNNQWTDSEKKKTWKDQVGAFLKGTFGEMTKTADLAAALDRTIKAGEASWYQLHPKMPPAGTCPLYDQVIALKAHCTTLGVDETNLDASIQAKTKEVLQEFRDFLIGNARLVPKPPESIRIGTRSTADLVKKLDEISKKNPDLPSADEYRAQLSKLKNAERSEVKNRAVALLAKSKQVAQLPSWPLIPPTSKLIELIGTPTTPEAVQLLAELKALAIDKEEERQPTSTPTSNLTYVSLLGFSGGGAASAVAKAKTRYGLGPNEGGGHGKASAEAQFSTEAINVRTQGFTQAKGESKIIIQTQDVKIRRWAASAEAGASAKVGNRTVGDAGTTLKESGRIRWSGATGRWELPTNETDQRVNLLMGSGVCFGRSAGRARFVTKLGKLREANISALTPPTPDAKGPVPSPPTPAKPSPTPLVYQATPYVNRLARALRVKPNVLARCLLELFPDPNAEAALADHEVLYFESRWTIPEIKGFKLRSRSPTQPAVDKVKTALGITSATATPPPPQEINDLRKALVPKFKKGTNPKSPFTLQAIAIRVGLGDEPEEKEKTLFQFAHEYIVVASASIVRREVTRTASMPDAFVWWANSSHQHIEASEDSETKQKLYQQAVPPLFLLDV